MSRGIMELGSWQYCLKKLLFVYITCDIETGDYIVLGMWLE